MLGNSSTLTGCDYQIETRGITTRRQMNERLDSHPPGFHFLKLHCYHPCSALIIDLVLSVLDTKRHNNIQTTHFDRKKARSESVSSRDTTRTTGIED
jgi:hypothetical protein